MAVKLEQLIIELRLQGGTLTKQQLKDIKNEARGLEQAFSTLGSGFGIGYLISQIGDLMQAFGQISGLSIAAEFRGVSYSLETVVRNSKQAAQIWRELKDLGNQIGVSPGVLGGIASQMIGGGDSPSKVMSELPILMNALAYGRVKSADVEPFLFNIQQIKGMGDAKANFADIRQMITRAPGIRSILAAGMGVPQGDLMKTLRGKDMSGQEVYDALLKGSEALAKGAASARALADPLFAVASLFQTLRQIMEPTGQILLTIGMPFLTLGRILATVALKVNEWTGGVAGLTALIGAGVVVATRTATVALVDFAKAMLGTAVAARTGSAATGAASGGMAAFLGGTAVGLISKLLRGGIIGASIGAIGYAGAWGMESMGKPGENDYGANKLRALATGAGAGALLGSIIPGLGTLAGAAFGGALGILGSFLSDMFGSKDKAAASTDPMVQEQKKTNRLLENLKLSPSGGGPRTARWISDFEAQYAMARHMDF